MLTFVVPLKSPLASGNWRLVSALANRCLKSLASQTDPGYRILLVCNEPPDNLERHANLTVLTLSLPTPGNAQEGMFDKWRKVREGLIHAREFAPCFVMVVDADDCVSRRLAAFVNRRPTAHGWFVETGYCHDEGTRWVFCRAEFHRLCGTSSIVLCHKHDLPDPAAPKSGCLLLDYGHSRIVDHMEKEGRPLEPLPFPAVVYITGTGENHSGYALGPLRSRKPYFAKLLGCRPLLGMLRRQFNLYPIVV
jgi:hypothetical protein